MMDGAVAVAAVAPTIRAQARSLLAFTSPATKTTSAERWRWDWGVRSLQAGVPKAVLVARLWVVFTVHITKMVVRTAFLKDDNQPFIS